MSSDEVSIRVAGLSKRFEMYAQPVDRLKQMILPKARRWLRRSHREYFREFWALRDVNFDVCKGETVGIVGRNGSGKSTLLQLICGILTPTVGQVAVNGRIAALLELGSGFNPEFTGRENVYLNAAVLGLSREEINSRYAAIVEFADIGDFVEQPVKTYSSGMYVRLAFAVAINVSPDILVVDEALSVGDEAFQRKCFARIDAIRKSGATVLFVSHAAGVINELCNRALLVDRGEVLTIGSPKYVVSRYQKLLYSPADKYLSIREAIRAGSEESAALDSASSLPIQATASAKDNGVGSAGDSERSPAGEPMGGDAPVAADRAIGQAGPRAVLGAPEEAQYEAGMVPKSLFRYDSAGANIIDPHVETVRGRRVNILQPQHEYVYVFRVRFDRSASAVRCGMLIKSVTGLELAGSVTSWHGEDLDEVAAGTEMVVRFRFPCMFTSGAYFLNAGVQGTVNGEDVYLDRWIDAAMFKVMHEPGRRASTTVDLDIRSDVRFDAVDEVSAR